MQVLYITDVDIQDSIIEHAFKVYLPHRQDITFIKKPLDKISSYYINHNKIDLVLVWVKGGISYQSVLNKVLLDAYKLNIPSIGMVGIVKDSYLPTTEYVVTVNADQKVKVLSKKHNAGKVFVIGHPILDFCKDPDRLVQRKRVNTSLQVVLSSEIPTEFYNADIIKISGEVGFNCNKSGNHFNWISYLKSLISSDLVISNDPKQLLLSVVLNKPTFVYLNTGVSSTRLNEFLTKGELTAIRGQGNLINFLNKLKDVQSLPSVNYSEEAMNFYLSKLLPGVFDSYNTFRLNAVLDFVVTASKLKQEHYSKILLALQSKLPELVDPFSLQKEEALRSVL